MSAKMFSPFTLPKDFPFDPIDLAWAAVILSSVASLAFLIAGLILWRRGKPRRLPARKSADDPLPADISPPFNT